MKAFVTRSYGSPLELTELDDPTPAPDEVLVRVRATSINPYDWHGITGEPYIARLMPGGLGLRGPKLSVLGCDMAGQVEAVGADVTRFRPGDDVFALLVAGGFAEYVSVREDMLLPKPGNLSYEQAAAVPMAGVTGLVAVREQGKTQPGQAVLINGASGGVGTFAVQIARSLGATVTGVCSAGNVDLVRSIGADEVIDYSAQDFTRQERRYDLLVDIAGRCTARACRRVLNREAMIVVVGGQSGRWIQPAGHAFSMLAAASLLRQRAVIAQVVMNPQTPRLLAALGELIEDGKINVVIDRHYKFDELPAAVSYQEQGHAKGKVVVTV
jgi:NADPH:quinone reductase-like Zn-dependent oxidoreductase